MKGQSGVVMVLAAVLATALPGLARAQVVVVGSDPSFPPFGTETSYQPAGYDVDLIKAIGKAAGFEVQVRKVLFDQLFSSLANGGIDVAISAISILDERRSLVDFSEPYFRSTGVLLVRTPGGPRSFADLAGKKVSTLSGASIYDHAVKDLERKWKTISVSSYTVAIGMDDLLGGRIGGFVWDGTNTRYALLKDPQYAGKVAVLGTVIERDDLGIAVKKGNTALLRKINAGLKKVRESGEQARIEALWMK
ncbi:MAG TPA: transporter substrate-binding domain-containing protein [Spirochaetia bacterium]|nr:transporter substrate-binding domain-containing protein [Spirochaetia bacterium]